MAIVYITICKHDFVEDKVFQWSKKGYGENHNFGFWQTLYGKQTWETRIKGLVYLVNLVYLIN